MMYADDGQRPPGPREMTDRAVTDDIGALRHGSGDPDPGGLDEDVLAQAEAAVAGLAETYVSWASEDLTVLAALLGELERDAERWPILLPEIFRISHDIKGQGGSFGYDLMTLIGNRLCRFVERIDQRPSQAVRDLIRLHADSMRAVLSQKLTGNGGPEGAHLLKGLDRAVENLPDEHSATS